MDDHHLREETIASTELLLSHFLHVMCDTVRLPDGRTASRDYIVHPGAVMVIPLLQTPEGWRVVLERQFRYPVQQVMLDHGFDIHRPYIEDDGEHRTVHEYERAGGR